MFVPSDGLALATSCGSEEPAQERQSARGMPEEICLYQLEQVNHDKGGTGAGYAFVTALERKVTEARRSGSEEDMQKTLPAVGYDFGWKNTKDG
jgi:hypothetical protein